MYTGARTPTGFVGKRIDDIDSGGKQHRVALQTSLVAEGGSQMSLPLVVLADKRQFEVFEVLIETAVIFFSI
jgi:hypothetical protein